jgi:hypothetical protein
MANDPLSVSRNDIETWLRDHAPDCGDNSCLFGGRGKGGMRTNGGCRCFKDVRPDMRRIFIERMWQAINTGSETKDRKAILLEAAEICRGEHLEDPQDFDDAAYDQGVTDCVVALQNAAAGRANG